MYIALPCCRQALILQIYLMILMGMEIIRPKLKLTLVQFIIAFAVYNYTGIPISG